MSLPRGLVIVVLIGVAAATWGYSIYNLIRHKADILIQAADAMEIIALPYRIAKLSSLPPDRTLLIPLREISRADIEDTWGAPRPEGRTHMGLDIFAERGTPVYALAAGFVLKTGESGRGGNYVYTIGAGGRRYYYAHLDAFAPGIRAGIPVTTETIIGYVGSTGNASTTPPHLHFEMHVPGRGEVNPYDLLIDRDI